MVRNSAEMIRRQCVPTLLSVRPNSPYYVITAVPRSGTTSTHVWYRHIG